jgi:hypothetical protein
MQVDQNFIDNLGFRGGWSLETINNKNFYTIRNPIYCQIFWLRYWYEIGQHDFRNQDFLVQLQDGNMSNKVTMDQYGNLVHTPDGWALIAYLGSRAPIEFGILHHPLNGHVVFFVYVFLVVVVFLVFYRRTKSNK